MNHLIQKLINKKWILKFKCPNVHQRNMQQQKATTITHWITEEPVNPNTPL